MNKLESLRLEVDSRRRTVAKLGKKVRAGGPVVRRESGWSSGPAVGTGLGGCLCRGAILEQAAATQASPHAVHAPPTQQVDMQRARLPQTRAKGEYEMENTIKVLQHKESKLSACRQSYKEHEALVYHQLTNLIRDTVWLKSYLSGALAAGWWWWGGPECWVEGSR